MPIVYCPDRKRFALHTDHTSYVIELQNNEIPMLAYWGKSLQDIPPMATWQTTLIPGELDSVRDSVHCAAVLPQEYAAYGSGDQRVPALMLIHANGSRTVRFVYAGHRILPGKPQLDGLPATYAKTGEVETLVLLLRDEQSGLELELSYTAFPAEDAITRSARIINRGAAPIRLRRAASACVDLYDGRNMGLIHLYGAWARERTVQRLPLAVGVQKIGSNCGTSGHAHSPFMALVDRKTTENYGDAYGFSLVYSGSFEAEVERTPSDTVRVTIGIDSFDFEWQLDPGAIFQTPEAVLVYSDCGIGEMSRRFHRLFRRHLCRGKYRDLPRPVLVNNWEATYFDFNEEKLLAIAEKAKQIGVDMLVLDDGWFGKRNDAHSSLGDWVCNTEKLPSGLKGLGDRLVAMGLKFGLWMEPEMVSPDSDLYRKHPDWCIHAPERPRGEMRWQLMLDLSRDEVCDYIINTVSTVLESAPISYIKWDCNRTVSEPGSAGLPPERQQEQSYRYVRGLYRVLEVLTTRFPDVLFEGCAAGGGRFDPGMLYYMPQIWTSDDTDAVERLQIQYGTSLVYPAVTMGAHVSACPNHQTGRSTPFSFRGDVAMCGQFGYELDLAALSDDELTLAREQIAFYKTYREVIHYGDLYRLASPLEGDVAAWSFIKEDTVLLCAYVQRGRPNRNALPIRLQGLEPTAEYIRQKTGECFSGAFLMQIGVLCSHGKDYVSYVEVFIKKQTKDVGRAVKEI